MLTQINLHTVLLIFLAALGISAVITGSKIGYPIRYTWCFIFKSKYTKGLWGMVRCPYCNSWWSAAFVSVLYGLNWLQILQMAFITCGLVKVLQTYLSGDGIAMVEDFEEIFNETKNVSSN